MNVLILITRGDTIGGAQMHVKDIAKKLQDDGHEVTVLFGKKGLFSELLASLGINYCVVDQLVREINIVQDLKALKSIVNKIKSMQPDIIAIHSSKVGIIGRIAAKITATPVVFTAHGWSFTEGVSPKKRMLYRWIEKFGMFFSDKVITVSNYDKQLALKKGVGSDRKIFTIQNGIHDINKSFFSSPEKSPPNIIMVARFQNQKDHLSLIKALHKLKDLKWNLQLVGEDGGMQQSVKDLVTELKMGERIEFLGSRSDVDELLSNSHIFILTSFWEGLPLSILEAMRAGLPVIVSNVGGVNEAVINGETGFVVNDFENLVKSLEVLIQSPETREKMGKLGRKRYVRYFTFDQMYDSIYALYQEVIAQHHKG